MWRNCSKPVKCLPAVHKPAPLIGLPPRGWVRTQILDKFSLLEPTQEQVSTGRAGSKASLRGFHHLYLTRKNWRNSPVQTGKFSCQLKLVKENLLVCTRFKVKEVGLAYMWEKFYPPSDARWARRRVVPAYAPIPDLTYYVLWKLRVFEIARFGFGNGLFICF